MQSSYMFCLLIWIVAPLATHSQCKASFQELQTDLFKVAKRRSQLLNQTSQSQRTPVSQQQIAQKKTDILHYFINSDMKNLQAILLKYPRLKNVRWTKQENPEFFKEILFGDYKWSKQGWGLLQLAAYFKKPEMLSMLLDLNLNIRTRKKLGGESIEDNALHISLRRNFQEGVDMLLKHQGLERFGKVKNRFIDEKSYDKKTPWFLAIRRDLSQKNTLFTNLIGQYRPSGYVQSYVIGRGPRDGFEVARSSRNPHIIQLAHRYLKISRNYKEFKDLKQLYGKNTKPPTPLHF